MGAEDGDGAGGDLVYLIDEMRTFGAQPLDDVPIVDDFVADIDRRPIFLKGSLDDIDRALDPLRRIPVVGLARPASSGLVSWYRRAEYRSSNSVDYVGPTHQCHNPFLTTRVIV